MIFAVEMPSTVSTPHSKFQLSIYKHSRLRFSVFFPFYLLFHQGVKVTVNTLSDCLKCGTQKGGVWAHFGNNFGCNMINTSKVICNHSQK